MKNPNIGLDCTKIVCFHPLVVTCNQNNMVDSMTRLNTPVVTEGPIDY